MKSRNPIGPLRPILALLPPLAAFILQWMFWPAIRPYVWFLFYPAVFFSSWIGGLPAGLFSTVLSTALVWWFFIPPEHSFRLENPMALVSVGVFMVMGVLFSFFHERLRKANQRAAEAMAGASVARERQRAEEALRESEERYRCLFENNHAVMLLIDPDGGAIVDANPAAAAFYGWTREELRRKKITEINTLPLAEVEAEMERARREQRRHFIFKHHLADGTIRDVEVFSGPILVEGRPLLYSIVHDITERKRAEKELLLAQFCIDRSAVGIFRIDEDGRIASVNDHACTSLGYRRDELCSLTVFDINPTFSRERWLEHRKNIRAQGSGTIETLHRRKDGSLFPVEVTVNYLEYEGKPFSFSFARDFTERKRYEDKLKHLSTHDELTGLANRTLLHDRLAQSIHYADRSRRLVAVLLLDLDRFKVINDSLGHSFGDDLLRGVARRLEKSVRQADTVARLGGDEFVILLAEVAQVEDVGLVATKILADLTEPHRIDGRDITVTASVGVSLYPRDGADGLTLIRNADIAMYRAKGEGGNTYLLYAPEMHHRVLEALELEATLPSEEFGRLLSLQGQLKRD